MGNLKANYRWGFVGLTMLSYLGMVLWPEFMAAIGAGHAGVWFLDMNTLLASNDAVTLGLNPYRPNPLDYLHDAHAYSDWWLQLRHLNLGRGDRFWLGVLVDGSFFAAIFWLVRPASFSQMLLAWLLVWSPPVILGFNRANPDLLIFALLAPVAHLLSSLRISARILAVLAVVLAIGLKYYPVVACLLVLLTARSRGEITRWIAVWVFIGAVLAFNLWDDVHRTGGLMAVATGFYTFGAAVLAANIGTCAWLLVGGLSASAAAFSLGWTRRRFTLVAVQRVAFADFALGAGLMVACFYLTVSYTYRLVFLLLTVPWLFDLACSDRRMRRGFARLILGSSIGLFWADGLVALGANALIGAVPDTTLHVWLDALTIGIHAAGWLWTLPLLAGLGLAAREAFKNWLAVGRLTADQARE